MEGDRDRIRDPLVLPAERARHDGAVTVEALLDAVSRVSMRPL
jgi:hypothetical protein